MAEAKTNLGKDMIITFLVAFSMILFEVFLPRFFSVFLDYNYVFAVISLATLGIGIGGFLSYRYFPQFKRYSDAVIGLYPLSLLTVVSLIYLMPFQGFFFYSFLTLIPFVLAGIILAGIFQSHPKQIHRLYFADLIGAGTGSLGAILLMNIFNPVRTIDLVTLLIFAWFYLSRVRFMGKTMKTAQSLILLLLAANMIYPVSQSWEFRAYRTSPYTAFANESNAGIILSDWNAFSRTDVYDADDEELLYITIDGGAVSPISKFTGDYKDVDYLKGTTGALAFQSPAKKRALIIGAGSGQEVLIAKMAGFTSIEAVDINKGSFDAVQKLRDFSGGIFSRDGVKAIISDGRNYIRQTDQQYDVIYLSLVKKASENGLGIALTENFIFTQEAIMEYMKKLSPQGRLAFLLHDETELYKIAQGAANYFRSRGMNEQQIKKQIAVIGTYQHLGHVVWGMDNTEITRPLIVVSNEKFTPEQSGELLASVKAAQQIPVHIPYIQDQWAALNEMAKKKEINVAANRDDMPFFYHKENGVPLPLVIGLVVTMAISFGMAMWNRSLVPMRRAVYFSGVALGFMLIEVSFVQRMTLPLGHPTLSFVLVLGVLLISGGIGSYCSARWIGRGRYAPLFLTGVLAIGIHLLIGWYDNQSIYLSLPVRIFVAAAMLVPLGFFMGMPFPFGLSRMEKQQIAFSWGMNGIMTVAGSLLAATLSLTFGFTITIAAGAAIYTLLYLVQPVLVEK